MYVYLLSTHLSIDTCILYIGEAKAHMTGQPFYTCYRIMQREK